MSCTINNCHLRGAAIYFFHNYISFWELKCNWSHKCTVHLSMSLWLSLTLCWKCERSRIQGLWICGRQWVIPWKLIVAASGRRGCLSVIAHKWSWLGETASLWSRLSPALASHIVPPPHSFHPKTTTAWPLRNLTLTLLAAPPGTCQPFTPSLGEHLEGEEGQTRTPGVGCCEVLTW